MNDFQKELQMLNVGDFQANKEIPLDQTQYNGNCFNCFNCFNCSNCPTGSICKIGRLISKTSSSGNTTATFVSEENRESAIAQALDNSGNIATDIGRDFPNWPQLLSYVNDNSSFTTTSPSYVWDSFTTTPQTRFFGAAITTPLLGNVEIYNYQLIVNLRVFCDNAHDVKIEVYNLDGTLADTINPAANLIDGSLDPNAGTADDVPFNWLNIRYYSNNSNNLPANASYKVVVSFKAVNYNINPPGSPNPAGLAFALDVYSIPVLITP